MLPPRAFMPLWRKTLARPKGSNSSIVRLQRTRAFDLSVAAGALSMRRYVRPWWERAAAMVNPTGPAPTMSASIAELCMTNDLERLPIWIMGGLAGDTPGQCAVTFKVIRRGRAARICARDFMFVYNGDLC